MNCKLLEGRNCLLYPGTPILHVQEINRKTYWLTICFEARTFKVEILVSRGSILPNIVLLCYWTRLPVVHILHDIRRGFPSYTGKFVYQLFSLWDWTCYFESIYLFRKCCSLSTLALLKFSAMWTHHFSKILIIVLATTTIVYTAFYGFKTLISLKFPKWMEWILLLSLLLRRFLVS